MPSGRRSPATFDPFPDRAASWLISGTAAPSVSAAFGLSYRRLDDALAGVFRLLPVCPGPDASTTAVAVIADLPASEARRVLGGLGRAHLVEVAPGAAGRWQMHDLVRLRPAAG
jgi:hypothetical protein